MEASAAMAIINKKIEIARKYIDDDIPIADLKKDYGVSSKAVWKYVGRIRSERELYADRGRPLALDRRSISDIETYLLSRGQSVTERELKNKIKEEHRNTFRRKFPLTEFECKSMHYSTKLKYFTRFKYFLENAITNTSQVDSRTAATEQHPSDIGTSAGTSGGCIIS